MKSMQFIVAPVLLALVGCGSQQSTSEVRAVTAGAIQLTGDEATNFAGALAQTGGSQVVEGSGNLSAQSIECHAPVVPDAIATCVIVTPGNSSISSSGASARSLFGTLVDKGALVHTGLLGVTRTKVKNVKCSRAAQQNAACAFELP